MERKTCIIWAIILFLMILTGCSSNPFSDTNRPTGNLAGPVVGGIVGGASAAALGGSKPVIGLAALGGAAIGYYATTLRYASGGIIQSGGQVYTLGDYVGIEIPSDKLFEVNSADFTPEAETILQSAVNVLCRYPNQNIMVSGNTSGFSTANREQKLSEERAKQVAGYLWANGITSFKPQSFKRRKLNYVGYGSYMPVANNITAEGIRANSRIQITAYPSNAELHIDKRQKVFSNIGKLDDSAKNTSPPSNYSDEFSGDTLPESATTEVAMEKPRNYSSISPRDPQPNTYYSERGNTKGAEWENDNAITGGFAENQSGKHHNYYKGDNPFAGYKGEAG